MSIISFGEFKEGRPYKTVDERAVRASSGIMFILGLIAFINGFVLQRYIVIPYISGFLMLNFLIGILINPKFSPAMFIGTLVTKNQSELPIGAIQKKFAWTLGLGLSATIFVLSILLQDNILYFNAVCLLCLICLFILFFETAFGICIGCQFYFLFIKLGLKKQPEIKPNCMGDSCEV